MADSDLGTRILRARNLLHLSQAEVGNRVGKSVRAVGSWERGESVPRNLYALEAALAPYFTVNGTPPPPPADPRERELFDLLTAEDAPPADRLTPAEAWEMIEEYRRRAKRRTA
jgi:transcriptional regulator with XRE-family HTH domain